MTFAEIVLMPEATGWVSCVGAARPASAGALVERVPLSVWLHDFSLALEQHASMRPGQAQLLATTSDELKNEYLEEQDRVCESPCLDAPRAGPLRRA